MGIHPICNYCGNVTRKYQSDTTNVDYCDHCNIIYG